MGTLYLKLPMFKIKLHHYLQMNRVNIMFDLYTKFKD